MASSLPQVNSRGSRPTATLYIWQRQQRLQRLEIQLDSEAWFSWLDQECSFRFTYYRPQGHSVNVTVRPEKRGTRTYWQAWKSIGGQTTKKYLAPSAKLTKTKLDAVGEWFFQQIQLKAQADPTMPLYAALVDLTWLVQRLIEQCSQPTLAQHAQKELERIQRQFGHATDHQNSL